MNKVYKSVWNAGAGTYVAAAETTKARGKKSRSTVGGALAIAATGLTMSGAVSAGGAMPVNPGPYSALYGMPGVEFCSSDVAYGINTSNCTIPTSPAGMTGTGDGTGGANGFGLFVSYGDSFHSATQPAFVVGTQAGDLVLHGNNGISMLDNVLMYGNQIKNLGNGDISASSMDAVNGRQLYQRTRYFNANSASSDSSTDARATGSNSVASGPSSLAAGSNSSAYGAGAIALASNSVALGANSVASRNDSVSVGYLAADGKTQYTRQITNLTAGSAGTDAVNVNQLNAAIASVSGGGGGGDVTNAVTYNDSGMSQITLKGSKGTKISNLVAGDISSAYSMDAVNGSQLFQTNQNVANVASNLANVAGNVTNITNTVNNIVNNGIAGNPLVVTYDSSDRNSITLGGTGSTSTVKLTNVAAGDISSASSTDAVNGGQLYQTNRAVANVTGGLLDLSGGVTNLSRDVMNVTNTVNFIENGGGIKYFHTNSTLADSSATGTDAVAIGGLASASANNSVALGSKSVASRVNAVSVGATGSERQIINVAAGTANTDAVNLAQMNTAIANASISGGGSPDAVIYDTPAHDKLTLGGTTATAPVALTNVAAGQIVSGSTDAVNGGQLYNAASGLAAALGAGAAVNKDGTITAPGYTISGKTYDNVGEALDALNSASGDLVSAAKYIKIVSTASAAQASGSDTVAIGGNALARATGAMAIGSGATSSYANATAIGTNAVTDAINTVSFGNRDVQVRLTHVANGINATDAVTVAQLDALQAQFTSNGVQSGGVKSMLLGAGVPVTSYIAVSPNVTTGSATSASPDMNAMAIGPVAAATGEAALTIGAGSAAGSAFSTSVGSYAGALSVNSTAIGAYSAVGSGADNSVAIGYNTRAGGMNSMAIGSTASSSAVGSVAIGTNSYVNVNATNGMAFGLNSSATAVNGVAIGYGAVADRANAVSVGSTSRQSQIINVAAGTANTDAVNVKQLSGVTAIIGGGAGVNTDGTIKNPNFTIGGQTYTDVGSAIAAAANSGTANAVQYDSTSRTKVTLGGTGASAPVALTNVANGVGNTDAVNIAQLQAMGASIGTSGVVTNSFVAYDDTTLGTVTLKGASGTTITNVKAGALTSVSMDAVNGAQLYQTNANVANVTNVVNNITNGGGIKYFHTNSTLADSSATGTNAVAIGGAASASALNSVALGSNSVANRTNAVSVGAAGSERQIINVANGTNSTDAVTVAQLQAMGANINSSGVVTGSFVAYDDTTKGKVTLGGTGAAKAVTLANVANGVASSDAVNMAQLQAMGANVDSSGVVTNSFVAYDDTTLGKVTLKGASGTTITNVKAGALTSASMDAVNGAQLYQTNADVANVAGNLANVAGNVTNVTNVVNNITNGGGIKYFHTNSTLADSSATGTNAVAIGGAASASALNSVALGSNSLANRANAVSVGAAGSERQIINVAAGTANTDAVNVKQLSGVTAIIGGGAGVNTDGTIKNPTFTIGGQTYTDVGSAIAAAANGGTADAVQYDSTSHTKVTLGGAGASAPVALTNVANGVGNTDAVNIAQLQAMGASIGTSGVVTNSFVAYDDTTLGTVTLKGASGTTITNVKAGALTSVSMDAVNGAQLYQTNANVANVAGNVTNVTNTVNNITNGGGIKYFHTNSTLADSTATGTNAVAIGGAANASALNSVALGSNSLANRANTVSVGAAGSERQIINVANGTNSTDAVTVAQLQAMGANINSSGVVTGSFVAYDDTTKGKVTLGGTGAAKAVTLANVANGVASSDAVNMAQLQAMGANVNSSGVMTNSFVAYDDTTLGTVTLKGASGTTITNMKAGALTAASMDAVNGAQLYQTNANVANVAGNVTNVTNTVNNITNGGGIKYFHTNSTLADSTATGTNAVAIGGAANASALNSVALGSNSLANRANTVSVGAAGSERQIINVANGTNSTDAVTVAQLQAMGATINSSGVVTGSFVAYDDTTKGKVTLGGAGSITPVMLANVAAGKIASTSHDAVNGSQLYGTAASVSNALGGGSTVLADGTLSAPTYTIAGTGYNDVGSALEAVDGQLSDINTNFATNLKYVKVVSTAAAAQASGADAVAIGGNALARAAGALAIGSGATSSYANATAIGANAVTDAINTVSFGNRDVQARLTHVANGINATDAVTVAQLDALQAQFTSNGVQSGGVKSMLLGAGVPVTNYIAVSPNVTGGAFTTASPDMNTMAIGPIASATGEAALTIGGGSAAGSAFSTAVGSYAGALSVNSTAIGAYSTVGSGADNSVAIGYNNRAGGMNSVAIGSASSSSAAGSVAIGTNSYVNMAATNGMAFGLGSSATAVNSVALGYNAVADRANAVSVGSSKQQNQIINVAAGTANTDAVNLGQMTTAINNAISGGGGGGTGTANAVVYDTSAHASVTLGNAGTPVKVSNVADGVANNDAVNVEQLKAMGATIGSSGNVTNAFVAYDDTTKSKVTLGGSSSTPVILTNVGAGAVTSASKDAINGSQLYGAMSSTAAALGGGSSVTANGSITKPSYTLNGKTYNDVGTALVAAANSNGADAVSYDTSAHTSVTLGNAGTPVKLSNVADGVANNDAVNVEQLKAMGANIDSSGNVSNAFVAYDDATKSKVTFGGSSSTPVILTNVGAGAVASGSKDAINGSQLYDAMSSTAAALGGGTTVKADGTISKPAYTLDGNTFNDVGTALAAVSAKVDTGSVNGVVYDTSAHDKLTLGGVDAKTPVTIANVADATSDDQAVNLKQLKEAGLNVDTSGNVTNSFVAYDNATRGTVTFNAGGAPTQLKNVAAATDATDAVNFGQMQTYVAQNAGGGGGTANGVAYDDSTKSKVTLGGAGSTTPVTLTNVAAGSNATDAVNYSQFSSLQSQINNMANGDAGNTTYVNINTPASGGTAAAATGSDSIAIGNGASATGTESIAIGKNTVTAGDSSVAMGAGASAPNTNAVALGANSTTDRDNSVSVGFAGAERQITNVAAGTQGTDAVNLNQLNSAMGNMSNSINNVDRNAAKGIASASALNIVTPYLPGRTTINAGIANYRGYQAVGLGVSRWNEKGTINYNLGVSSSGGNSTIVRAGIGIVLGN